MTQLSLLDIADRYPAVPGFKSHGTSEEAAGAMKTRAATLRDRALLEIRAARGGLTADECATLMGVSVLAVRPRFSELYRDGKVLKSGARRQNASGMSANVWVAR